MTVLRSDANDGRVALVTGGGSGIGRATAVELARTGATVAVSGRRAGLLEETCAQIVALGGECFAVPTDLREATQVDALVDLVLEEDVPVGRLGTPEEVASVVAFRRHPVGIRDAAVAQDDLGMTVEIGVVEEPRLALDLEAGCAGLDDQERLLAVPTPTRPHPALRWSRPRTRPSRRPAPSPPTPRGTRFGRSA